MKRASEGLSIAIYHMLDKEMPYPMAMPAIHHCTNKATIEIRPQHPCLHQNALQSAVTLAHGTSKMLAIQTRLS